jgi:hypothetical protein
MRGPLEEPRVLGSACALPLCLAQHLATSDDGTTAALHQKASLPSVGVSPQVNNRAPLLPTAGFKPPRQRTRTGVGAKVIPMSARPWETSFARLQSENATECSATNRCLLDPPSSMGQRASVALLPLMKARSWLFLRARKACERIARSGLGIGVGGGHEANYRQTRRWSGASGRS